MESLFDTSDSGPRVPPGEGPSVIKSSNTGMGHTADSDHSDDGYNGSSGAVGFGGAGVAGGGGKYVGFGSNNVPPPKKSGLERVVEGAKAARAAVKDKIETIRKDIQSKRDGDDRDQDGYYTHSDLAPAGGDDGGGGGGGSGSGYVGYAGKPSGGGRGSGYDGYRSPEGAPTFRPLGGGAGGGDAAAPMGVDTAYESRLVDEITMPAGVRAAPQKDQLQAFVQKCSSLDSYKIASLLGDKLADDQPNKTRVRALYVIEALLLSDIAAITDCFADQLDSIASLRSDDSSSVRELAIRITDIVQGNAPSSAVAGDGATQSQPAPVMAPVPSASLLDLDDGDASGGGGPSSAPSSMFDGLVVTQAGATPAGPSGGGGLLDGMLLGGGANPSSSEGAPPATGGAFASMFAGMKLAGGDVVEQSASAPAPQASDPLADLFGGPSTGTAAAPLPAGGSDLLSLDTQSPSVAGSSGSYDPLGFDLLGGGSPTVGGASPMGSPAPMQSGFSFVSNGQPQQMSGSPLTSSMMGGSGTLGMQQGYSPSAMHHSQPQGFGLSGSTQSSPLIGGGGMDWSGVGSPSGFGLSGTGAVGGSGAMGSPRMGMSSPSPGSSSSHLSAAQRSNSFGLSAGKSPKKSEDPFSFISSTVASQANKKA